MNAESDKKEVMQLNIAEVIRKKSELLHRLLPGFVKGYLRRILHEAEINDILLRYRDADGVEFARALIEEEFKVRFEVFGEEKIPTDGRLIIASNHPLGGFDGLALINLMSRYRQRIKFPVNDLLMHVPNLRDIFIPINKTGNNTIELARQFDDVFRSDDTILYFPAGICSRKIDGRIQDLDWKKTFVSKAKSTQRDILPIYFDGQNSDFFYNLARLRKRLGIKVNIEMLYLVDELFNQHNATYKIYIGDVIPHKELMAQPNNNLLAQQIREKVYRLAKG